MLPISPAYRPSTTIAAAAGLGMFLSGCSVTGGTTRQTLSLGNNAPDRLAVPIVVDQVGASRKSAGLINIGTQPWGRFNLADLANIRGSLEDTLRAHSGTTGGNARDRLRLFVTIRKYLVAHSNTVGGVLVAVDWCAARNNGSAVYREVFYAASKGRFVVTLGQIKDNVHRTIVKRIAVSALHLAAVNRSPNDLPVSVDGTYLRLRPAIAALPPRLASSPYFGPGLVLKLIGVAELVATRPRTIPWGAARTENFDKQMAVKRCATAPIQAPKDPRRATGDDTKRDRDSTNDRVPRKPAPPQKVSTSADDDALKRQRELLNIRP